MRIKAISLAWFRGAAESLTLDLNSKSIVVYGENGAGKSSFVDAIEYVLSDGKIGHLSHEYSGRHQEKGVINTHTPDGINAVVTIALDDGSELKTEIQRNGTVSISGAASLRTWDYRCTVLRQDEVAAFIRSTKGGKYSEILPLLGLRKLELAAENVHNLIKAVEKQGRVRDLRAEIDRIRAKRQAVFGNGSDSELLATVAGRYTTYCPAGGASEGVSRCDAAREAIQRRMASFSEEQRRHHGLRELANADLMVSVRDVRAANAALAAGAEPFISQKLEVLQSASKFLISVQSGVDEISCPACGQAVSAAAFRAHVDAEQERLGATLKTVGERRRAIHDLSDRLNALRSIVSRPEILGWSHDVGLGENVGRVRAFDVAALRDNCTEDHLEQIESEFVPIISKAIAAAADSPPEVKDLASDDRLLETAREVISSRSQVSDLEKAGALTAFLSALEDAVRAEIRGQSKKIIDELSSDIQTMWKTLHPAETIEGIRLYMPDGADKAIDIALKFFGVDQESPRLTLSEGYRNSLGLCLFLGMAKRGVDGDRPLFLDDVVVSLDRNHRGMMVDLLEKEFSGRQLILLTHDRDWFAELRERLDNSAWMFKALLPYDSPGVGIRWSAKTSSFNDARWFLSAAPDAAGNTARKIMDTELTIKAERLKVRLPFRAANRNDHRTVHDFLFQIIADGPACFRRKGSSGYEPNMEAIDELEAADKLLIAWGNRASHGFDIVRSEAQKLIDECEAALQVFTCTTCNKPVYKLEDTRAKLLQCECGNLQWRYGDA